MTREPKLTKAQYFLLVELSDREEHVNESYQPAQRLVALGYATARSAGFGTQKLTISDAGRAALSAARGDDE